MDKMNRITKREKKKTNSNYPPLRKIRVSS